MSLISVLLLLSKCTSELSSYVMPLSLDFDTSLQSLLCSQETLRSSPELWPEQSEYMSSLFTSYIPAMGLSFQLVKKAGLLKRLVYWRGGINLFDLLKFEDTVSTKRFRSIPFHHIFINAISILYFPVILGTTKIFLTKQM